jgi:hypothetical protein
MHSPNRMLNLAQTAFVDVPYMCNLSGTYPAAFLLAASSEAFSNDVLQI